MFTSRDWHTDDCIFISMFSSTKRKKQENTKSMFRFFWSTHLCAYNSFKLESNQLERKQSFAINVRNKKYIANNKTCNDQCY